MFKNKALNFLMFAVLSMLAITLFLRIEAVSPLAPEVINTEDKGYAFAFIAHTEEDESRRKSLHQLLHAFFLIANSLTDEELVMLTEIVVDAASCVYVNHGLDGGTHKLRQVKWLVFNSSEKLGIYRDFLRLARERGITLPAGTGCKKE